MGRSSDPGLPGSRVWRTEASDRAPVFLERSGSGAPRSGKSQDRREATAASMSLRATNRFGSVRNRTRRNARMTMPLKPTVLILVATCQIGRFILEHLKHDIDTIHIRIATRRPEQVRTVGFNSIV